MKSQRWTNNFARVVVCLAFLVASAGLAYSADAKFGRVNLEGVYSSSTRIKAVLDEMKKIQTEAEAKVAILKAEADKIEEKLGAEENKLKKEDKEKLAKELESKNQSIEQEQQTARAKVMFTQRSVQNVIGLQIRAILEKISKEDGLTAVLAHQAVLYSADVADLTERVTKELDAMPAPESAKP